MRIPAEQFSRDTLAALSESERGIRLRELESLVNLELQCQRTLPDFQQQLYAIIEELSSLGHFLGRWEYDSEIEIWGGKSYMEQSVMDELLLRSEFPYGVRIAWRDYESLRKPVA
jgi:uncharacterized metal-binding protein YceD (DUF177 family)